MGWLKGLSHSTPLHDDSASMYRGMVDICIISSFATAATAPCILDSWRQRVPGSLSLAVTVACGKASVNGRCASGNLASRTHVPPAVFRQQQRTSLNCARRLTPHRFRLFLCAPETKPSFSAPRRLDAHSSHVWSPILSRINSTISSRTRIDDVVKNKNKCVGDFSPRLDDPCAACSVRFPHRVRVSSSTLRTTASDRAQRQARPRGARVQPCADRRGRAAFAPDTRLAHASMCSYDLCMLTAEVNHGRADAEAEGAVRRHRAVELRPAALGLGHTTGHGSHTRPHTRA